MIFRQTRQRQTILEIIEQRGGHLTADQIYGLARKKFPRLSLGTVYRNLRVLVAQGSVRELDFGAAFSYFEAAKDQHYHLVCRVCGHIADLEGQIENRITAMVQRSRHAAGFMIEDHRLDFIGVCPRCQTKSSRSVRQHQSSKLR